MKLLTKYLIFILPFVLFLFSIETYLVYQSSQELFEQELERNAISNFEMLNNISHSIDEGASLQELDRNLFSFSNGHLQWKKLSIEELNKSSLLSTKQREQLLKIGRLHIHDISYKSIDDKDYSFFLIKNRDISFVIRFTQDTEKFNKLLIGNLKNSALKTFLILMIFFVVAYFVGVKYITKPLGQLKEHLESLAQGDFSVSAVDNYGTEIYEILQVTNQVASSLDVYQKQLVQSRDDKINLLEKFRHQDRLKSVGQMSAGVAHELGTPLNVISGRASIILEDSDAPEIKASAKIIKGEAQRMTKIIQNLLSFSRKKKGSATHCDLRNVVSEVVELLSHEAKKYALTLENSITEPLLVNIDKTEVQQVILNIVKNAMQACQEDGKIQIRSLDSSLLSSYIPVQKSPLKYIGVEVIDNGSGMSEEVKDMIFDPFFTTKDVGEGTGLGMSVCHGIISEANGFIVVDSTLGVGTSMKIIIPSFEKDV